LSDPEGYGGSLLFTVSNNGTVSVGSNSVSYASGIASANGNQLTVNGAAVTVNASGLTTSSLLLDYQTSESKSAPFTVYLLPGLHALSNASNSVTFTVNPDGTHSFPASEDTLLALQGSTTLIVKALH
jgi:hypothetical protein